MQAILARRQKGTTAVSATAAAAAPAPPKAPRADGTMLSAQTVRVSVTQPDQGSSTKQATEPLVLAGLPPGLSCWQALLFAPVLDPYMFG